MDFILIDIFQYNCLYNIIIGIYKATKKFSIILNCIKIHIIYIIYIQIYLKNIITFTLFIYF